MLLYYPAFKDIQRQSEIDSHREVVESFSIKPHAKNNDVQIAYF